MTLVQIFLGVTVGVAVFDYSFWSEIVFIRNVQIPEWQKVPFSYAPALKIEFWQAIRWVTIGVLMTACNGLQNSPFYDVIGIASVGFAVVHSCLSLRRYWRAFSVAAQAAQKNRSTRWSGGAQQ